MTIPTRREILELALLEGIYQQGSVSVGWVREQLDGEHDSAANWLRDAQERDLVRGDGRLNPTFTLSSEGDRLISQVRARRQDTRLRVRTLRNRYVHWVYNNTKRVGSQALQANKFIGTEFAWFEGDHFESDEVADAVDYLEKNGLLTASWASGHVPIRVGITHEGRECVEDYDADVAAFGKRVRGTAAAQVFHIHADNGTFAIATGANSQATASSTEVDVEAALVLAQAIQEALPLLPLGDEAERRLSDLRDPDPSKVKRALQWFSSALTDTSTGALGAMLAGMAQAALNG